MPSWFKGIYCHTYSYAKGNKKCKKADWWLKTYQLSTQKQANEDITEYDNIAKDDIIKQG